jgi:UDP-N-acetyl-D-galactosamine dehydrogenase
VAAVSHDEFNNLEEDYFLNITNGKSVFVDIKGIFKNKIQNLTYFSL